MKQTHRKFLTGACAKATLASFRNTADTLNQLDIPFDGALQAEADSIAHELAKLVERMSKLHKDLVD